eukprot:scaffold10311_cov17-Tisochrysis_lutea.AAC.1
MHTIMYSASWLNVNRVTPRLAISPSLDYYNNDFDCRAEMVSLRTLGYICFATMHQQRSSKTTVCASTTHGSSTMPGASTNQSTMF